MDYTLNIVSKCRFFFIFKHLRALKRSWKIFHGGPGKSWIFLSVKECEPWCVLWVCIRYLVSYMCPFVLFTPPPRITVKPDFSVGWGITEFLQAQNCHKSRWVVVSPLQQRRHHYDTELYTVCVMRWSCNYCIFVVLYGVRLKKRLLQNLQCLRSLMSIRTIYTPDEVDSF